MKLIWLWAILTSKKLMSIYETRRVLLTGPISPNHKPVITDKAKGKLYKIGLKNLSKDDRKLVDEFVLRLTYGYPILQEFNDHQLKGVTPKKYRGAHIIGQQLILIYRIDSNKMLHLIALGNHNVYNKFRRQKK